MTSPAEHAATVHHLQSLRTLNDVVQIARAALGEQP